MKILRIILIPFSVIYAFIIYLRNVLYDKGFLNSFRVSRPVISIGNISTGGTGKTPFTIFIAKYFLNKNKSVGIISRGYKRKSAELTLVSDGNYINESVDESGDELILIANRLSEYKNKYFIAASSDRVKAAEYLISKFDPDIIILDDGFQHRRLKRDLDIVLIDSVSLMRDKFKNLLTLPSGNLREYFKGILRSDLIVQNNKSEDLNFIPEIKRLKKDKIIMRYKSEYLIDYKSIILENKNSEAILFSGIADDSSFIKMAEQSGIRVREAVKFSDHHNYTTSDIDKLKSKFSKDMIYITTEKDFIKIKAFDNFCSEYPLYYLKMEIFISENENIMNSKLETLIK